MLSARAPFIFIRRGGLDGRDSLVLGLLKKIPPNEIGFNTHRNLGWKKKWLFGGEFRGEKKKSRQLAKRTPPAIWPRSLCNEIVSIDAGHLGGCCPPVVCRVESRMRLLTGRTHPLPPRRGKGMSVTPSRIWAPWETKILSPPLFFFVVVVFWFKDWMFSYQPDIRRSDGGIKQPDECRHRDAIRPAPNCAARDKV